ncbi:site-specific integrase [Corynebacterium sp. S7]
MAQRHFTNAEFASIIQNYTPTSVNSVVWSEIEEFVRSVVVELNIDAATTSRDTLRVTLGAVSRLTAFAWTLYGELTREGVFEPTMIGNYFESEDVAHLRKSTAGTQRSLLMRVGEMVNPEWDADFQHAISYTPALQPYQDYEITRFRTRASMQPTEERKQDYWTILALTLGAGLRAGEICKLRASDVRVDGIGILISPFGFRGAEPRTVPLHVQYHEHIHNVLDVIEPNDYVFRPGRDNEHVSLLSAFLERVTSVAQAPPPDTRRLRNTWVKNRILAGIPEDVICAAAGLRSLHQFGEFVLEAGALRSNNFRFMLQGGFTPMDEGGDSAEVTHLHLVEDD